LELHRQSTRSAQVSHSDAVAQRQSFDCGGNQQQLRLTESVNANGDGDTAPDWEVVDEHQVKLRAKRSGQGNDRIYTITITATDSHGNTSYQTVFVTVPRN
jgi:hypothetical protein